MPGAFPMLGQILLRGIEVEKVLKAIWLWLYYGSMCCVF